MLWRPEPNGTEKPRKVPYQPNGRKALINAPRTWSSFDHCLQALAGYAGVFTALNGDGLCGVDIDGCVENVRILPWARAIVDAIASYTEYSPSGTGIRIFAFGAFPDNGRKRKLESGDLELYQARRFLSLTGHRVGGTPPIVEHRESELLALHRRFFPPKPVFDVTRPVVEVSVDDKSLLRLAMNARNGDRFAALWNGHGVGEHHSEEDLALCSLLAFWTGRDARRIDRLFRASSLYRPKWDRDDYRNATIQKAIRSCRKAFGERYA